MATRLEDPAVVPETICYGNPPVLSACERSCLVKDRLIKWGFAVSSLAVLVAVTGAGRKFG